MEGHCCRVVGLLPSNRKFPLTSVSNRIPSQRRDRPNRRRPAPRNDDDAPHQRLADAVTIAWTVSVTAVFLADLVTVAAYLYARWRPDIPAAQAFGAIMLASACVLGLVSLALLPVAWRIRPVRPPVGYAVFAGSVAAAPIVALAVRLWS